MKRFLFEPCYFETDGSGYWSDVSRYVRITAWETTEWSHDNEEGGEDTWGELRIHFDVSTFHVETDGLIYTDEMFSRYAKNWLGHELGIALTDADLSYSEQGMQGDDYVSFDVNERFLKAFNVRYGS